MQEKKYQVFVSSTYTDLVDERREVIEAIIDLGHIPAGMEGFPAIDMEQFRYIKKVIDQCDYYVLIVGGRYGSLSEDGTSFTEREYRYAVETGKVVIAFVLDSTAATKLPVSKVETDADIKSRLEKFTADVMEGRLVRIWADRASLSKAVIKSLIVAFEEFPATGWVRGSVQATEDVLSQINELRVKNETLVEENTRLRNVLTPAVENIASFDSGYVIPYRYTNNGTKRTATMELTWRQIFTAIAPSLSTPNSTSLLTTLVERCLRSAGHTSGRYVDIETAVVNQIRVQFVALRLLHEYRRRNTAGGAGEWVELTESGRKQMVENLVVKKSAASS